MNLITVAAVDDHGLFLRGLEMILNGVPHISMVGKASNGESFLALVRDQKPDIALVDISLGKENGIHLIRRIREASSGTKVIMLTMHESIQYIIEALSEGPEGYMLKDSTGEQFIEAIEIVAGGGTYLSPVISEALVRSRLKKAPSTQLTKREHQILKLIVDGLKNQEIADLLFLSLYTVETHRKHIMQKSGAKNLAELIKWARDNGLI